ncbi:transporter substrate-binding domain-containing protein [Fervidibacillus halotolerans]|uniref:Transporter substrate-binding domain-containing protein n=1 Tax=Fervidibacillus halotolerans TaxID=2980027 RepID=A0A9E8M1W5_9BACI|nr:transporter substrate-binding domain-containing protein [Fervidibacillus halotolerans]WAA12759.1 transporter substrate-binding domain-containing protein [Fervidibacillus halotolerans]
MKKLIGIMFTILTMMVILTGCGGGTENNTGDSSKEKKVLKMATSADFPPFESYNEEGEFVGFDIDLAQAIADELGYELEIQDMKFDGLIGALQSNRVDIVLAGMSATEERKKNVDFSIEYHRSGEMFLTNADKPVTSLEELEGKLVGVQLGTIQEEGADVLKEEYSFEVKKVDSAAVLVQELLSGRVDVIYMDKQVATGYMEEHGLAGFDDPTTSSPGMAIAFPKGSDLVEKVNDILQTFQENGKLDELKDKWELEEG